MKIEREFHCFGRRPPKDMNEATANRSALVDGDHISDTDFWPHWWPHWESGDWLRAIVADALRALPEPGTVVAVPFGWPALVDCIEAEKPDLAALHKALVEVCTLHVDGKREREALELLGRIRELLQMALYGQDEHGNCVQSMAVLRLAVPLGVLYERFRTDACVNPSASAFFASNGMRREKAATLRDRACTAGCEAEQKALRDGENKHQAKTARIDAMIRVYRGERKTLTRNKASTIYSNWTPNEELPFAKGNL